MKSISIKTLIALIALLLHSTLASAKLDKGTVATIRALQKGQFGAAAREANKALKEDDENIYAHGVLAIVKYLAVSKQFIAMLRSMRDDDPIKVLKALRSNYPKYDRTLARIDKHLKNATSKKFRLIMRPSAWQFDWNSDGRFDEQDRTALEVDHDRQWKILPPNDPRRRPVVKFDYGDIYWARSYICFQRAFFYLLTSYSIDDASNWRSFEIPLFEIKLANPKTVSKARRLILQGLNFADKAREAYLAETDDDREWVPNPQQKSYGMPLTMTPDIYEKWQAIISHIRDLVLGKTGLGLDELYGLAPQDLHGKFKKPQGYLNIGRMLRKPKNIEINPLNILMNAERGRMDQVAREIFGSHYRKTMPRSPLLKLLKDLYETAGVDEKSFEQKLRYLFWLN